MALISSTTNEWPQIDHKGLNNSTTMTPAAPSRMMTAEKAGQDLVQQQQQALKCPRCDSSNTKFCYYNNYSLTQPRHFCKACKRYWTRGGTLRNVPVGGGCRKNNKRLKRPSSSSSASASALDGAGPSSSSTTTNNNSSNPNPSQDSHIDHQMNQILYGLPTNPFMDSSPNINTPASGFDFHQLGLGFDSYRNRFSDSLTYNPIFSTSQSTTTAPTMASKFTTGGGFSPKDVQARGGPGHQNNNNQYFQNLFPFEDLQIAAGNHGDGGGNGGTGAKVAKAEENGLEWSNTSNIHVNVNEQMGMSDPTVYWSSTNLGSNWHDPANLGSSVSSLI